MAQLLESPDQDLEDFEPFVWYVFKKVRPNIPFYENEDWLQLGLMEVFEALPSYNPEYAKLSTFLFYRIKRRWLNEIAYHNNKSHIPDHKIRRVQDVEDLSPKECPNSTETRLDNELALREIESLLPCVDWTESDALCFEVMIGIRTQLEVAKLLNINQSTVSYRTAKLRDRLKRIYDTGGSE